MLTAIVMVCSLAITPELTACDASNSVHVLRVPERFGNPKTCMLHAQAYLAETVLGRDLSPDQRVKTVCAPSP
jgi:hypothetical protein